MHVSLRLDKRNILKFKIFLQRFSFKSYPRKQYCCLRSLTWPQRSTVGLRFFKCIPSALSRHEHHARFFRKALAQLGTQPSGFQPTLPPPPRGGGLWTPGKAVHGVGLNSMCMAIHLHFHVENWRNLVKVSDVKGKWLNKAIPPPPPQYENVEWRTGWIFYTSRCRVQMLSKRYPFPKCESLKQSRYLDFSAYHWTYE